MGKIKIEIVDKDNGGVGVTVTPTLKELEEISSRVGDENTPASIWYAITAIAAIRKMSIANKQTDPQESKEKSKIWMPAPDNVRKLFS